MGACASCIGLQRSGSEDPETSRLLSDDYRQYGGVHNAQRQPHQPDPESLRREREMLEAIVHRMSSRVIDVFNAPPASAVRSRVSCSALHASLRNVGIAQNTQVNGPTDGDAAFDDTMPTVKDGRAEPIISVVGTDFIRWKAVKDAIG